MKYAFPCLFAGLTLVGLLTEQGTFASLGWAVAAIATWLNNDSTERLLYLMRREHELCNRLMHADKVVNEMNDLIRAAMRQEKP